MNTLELADFLTAHAKKATTRFTCNESPFTRAAAELRRLAAVEAELAVLRDQEPVYASDNLEYSSQGMGCGLEDRGITDRYEAMQYGWDEAIESMDRAGPFYTAPVPSALETLDKPARVRGVVFGPGVKVITVIQAAQRCAEEYVPEDAPGIRQEILRGLANSSQLSGEQAMIKLSNDQIDILGRPNFSCAKIAKYLIAAGVYEDKAKKAEYEQAVFIHWAMVLFNEHGEKWREVGEQILSECAGKIKTKAVEND